MRITNAMINSNYLTNIQTNLSNISKLQNQLSSGNNISSGSDDPSAASKIMQLNDSISANTQYSSNIKSINHLLDTTDTTLSESNNVLSRIRTLLVKAGNGTYTEDEISSIKDEVVSCVKELGDELNTSYSGTYIFGGSKTDSKPITVDSSGNMSYADASGNAVTSGTAVTQIGTKLYTDISQGVSINYNVSASDLLQFKDSDGTTDVNAMSIFSQIITDLGTASDSTATDENQTSAKTSLENTDLTNLDKVIQNFTTIRSKVGTLEDRMDTVSDVNEDRSYNMTSSLSDVQDVDMAEKEVDYSSAQTVYKASLQVSSKVLETTLLDYL